MSKNLKGLKKQLMHWIYLICPYNCLSILAVVISVICFFKQGPVNLVAIPLEDQGLIIPASFPSNTMVSHTTPVPLKMLMKEDPGVPPGSMRTELMFQGEATMAIVDQNVHCQVGQCLVKQDF